MVQSEFSEEVLGELQSIVTDTTAVHSKFAVKLLGFMNQSADEMVQDVVSFTLETAAKMLLALVIWYAGRWVLKQYKKFLGRVFLRRRMDEALRKFILSLVNAIGITILVVIVIGTLGFKTTSFVALFASAGVGIGLALSGTLQNFAGGVLILLTKSYRVGHYIEAQGQAGKVKEIKLFHTLLNTSDNKTIVIPNGLLANGVVNNYTAEPNRRVEWLFGIAYGDDFAVARQCLLEILAADPRILQDREQLVAINELGADSIIVVMRAWTPVDDFWNVFFDVNEKVYNLLPARGVSFPFPQLDVTIK